MPPRLHAAEPHAQRDSQGAEQLEVAEVVGQELDQALILGFFNIDIDIYTVNTKLFRHLHKLPPPHEIGMFVQKTPLKAGLIACQ